MTKLKCFLKEKVFTKFLGKNIVPCNKAEIKHV